ncbi:MAG: hypothetical protein DHS20C16_35700 [Phycisphaerae bacterium]|nr:MAG: hypothetical protein DHS20C16_35700 [Phycisphaerae bacterium]
MAANTPFEFHFEWDPEKAQRNFRKHKISFEQSAAVFGDPHALTIYDHEHSDDEERWVTLGLDNRGVPLVVCHTYHAQSKDKAVIRIISARKATKNEDGQYHGKRNS